MKKIVLVNLALASMLKDSSENGIITKSRSKMPLEKNRIKKNIMYTEDAP